MTSKSLQNLVTGLVDVVIKAKGFNPATGVKGGEREMAQSLVGMAIKDSQNEILGRIPGLTPEVIAEARASLAGTPTKASGKPALKVADAPTEPEATDEAVEATDETVETSPDGGEVGILPGESHNDAEKRLHMALDGDGKPVSNAPKKKERALAGSNA